MKAPNEDTEILMKQLFGVVFSQFDRYVKMVENFDPLDWKLFVKERNKQRGAGQASPVQEIDRLDDELSPEEVKHNREEEEKKDIERENGREEESKKEDAAPRDFISEIIQDGSEKEMKKLGKMYDYHTLTKLLRMLDLFTSIASLNDVFKHYLEKTFNEV